MIVLEKIQGAGIRTEEAARQSAGCVHWGMRRTARSSNGGGDAKCTVELRLLSEPTTPCVSHLAFYDMGIHRAHRRAHAWPPLEICIQQ
jgi:hypothetical protein